MRIAQGIDTISQIFCVSFLRSCENSREFMRLTGSLYRLQHGNVEVSCAEKICVPFSDVLEMSGKQDLPNKAFGMADSGVIFEYICF